MKLMHVIASFLGIVSKERLLDVQYEASVSVFKAAAKGLENTVNNIQKAQDINNKAILALKEQERHLHMMEQRASKTLEKFLGVLS
jgi:hypothetical protein